MRNGGTATTITDELDQAEVRVREVRWGEVALRVVQVALTVLCLSLVRVGPVGVLSFLLQVWLFPYHMSVSRRVRSARRQFAGTGTFGGLPVTIGPSTQRRLAQRLDRLGRFRSAFALGRSGHLAADEERLQWSPNGWRLGAAVATFTVQRSAIVAVFGPGRGEPGWTLDLTDGSTIVFRGLSSRADLIDRWLEGDTVTA